MMMINTAKLVTPNHLYPLIYKVLNAYSIYMFLYINRHGMLFHSLAKAGKGRAGPPVIIYIAFTYFHHIVSIIQMVKEPLPCFLWSSDLSTMLQQ